LARALPPGKLPPKPSGVGRPAMSPQASANSLSGVATNLSQSITDAQGARLPNAPRTSAFDTVYQAGFEEYNGALLPNAAAKKLINKFGISAQDSQWINPALEAGNDWSENRFSDEDLEMFSQAGEAVSGPAVGQYDIPTSTSNVSRPRTLAAGYDEAEGTVTVVFRDGTFWNYYGIRPGTWLLFKESYSKQEMLNSGAERNWQGRAPGLLINEASWHGPANLNDMTEEAQSFFVTVSRSAQISYRENRPRYNKGFRKVGSQVASYKNREYRANLRKASLKAAASAAQSSSQGKNTSRGGKNRPTANRAN